ncbi:hypothetical protein F5890DRAFT_1414394 [Lentinula detonsa]|uniref:RING-type domain-containing protein n=1 Tax=Lentinula detonsa TaxID=2804962 RepID=A0AA38PWL5_9AGAR|nr:hypothetical protein F5890DRAFT_1414394 [Lentinula detonsa]
MGNSSSSSSRSHEETVDFGFLIPQGVYTGPRDWNQAIVTQLICARRLAPFYRPLEDYDDSWTDDQILAARKELPDSEGGPDSASRPEPLSASSTSSKSKRPNTLKEPSRPEAAVYRGATECPICFLYYPPNINHSRCCDQAICTECFVQIKRSEPTTTHLVSESAACPYCVQENFGVVYTPPPWRAGIGSEGSVGFLPRYSPKHSQQSLHHPTPTHKRRQKSFSADSPEVVTTDQIRPDWEAKLAAVRAAVTRRANRRIIMRQVGDRLIPVGVTSGRVHALLPEEAASPTSVSGDNGGGSWRSRRRPQGGNGLEQYLGQDLEEIMMMEAMRLSLLEHEAQQRREAEEKKKAEVQAKQGTSDNETTQTVASGSSSNGTLSSSAPNLNMIDLSSTPPSSSSSTPAHQKNESLRVKRGSLFSRSRSPSPAPPSSQPSLPIVPPFSTLGAALSSTSTASAILRSNSSTSASSNPSPERSTTESASTNSLPHNSTTSPAPPSLTIAPFPPPAAISLSPESIAPPESSPMASIMTTPYVDNNATYENLPSSPEETPYELLIPKDSTREKKIETAREEGVEPDSSSRSNLEVDPENTQHRQSLSGSSTASGPSVSNAHPEA